MFRILVLALLSFTTTAQSDSTPIPFNETVTFENSDYEVSIARCYLSDCRIAEYIQEDVISDKLSSLLIETLKDQQFYVGICLGLNCTTKLYETVPTYLSIGKTQICEETGCDVDIGNTVFGSGNVFSSGNTAVSGGTANVGNVVYAGNGPVSMVSVGNTASGNGPVNAGNKIYTDGNGQPVNMVSTGNTAVSSNGDVNTGNIIVIGGLSGRKLLKIQDVHKCGDEFVDIPPCCSEETVLEDVRTCNFASDKDIKCRDFKLVNGDLKKIQADQIVQVCL